MKLTPFREEQLPELLRLRNGIASARRQLSPEALREELTDLARAGGRQVLVARSEAGPAEGFAAWVRGGAGQYFASPFFAVSQAAAELLLDRLLAEAADGCFLRVSAFPTEEPKLAALRKSGFRELFRFLEYEAPLGTAERAEPPLPPGIDELPVAGLRPEEYRLLHNESFRGVDNTLEISLEQAQETLSSPSLWAQGSLAWRDATGAALAFSLAHGNGELEAIGIHPRAQRRGFGTRMLGRILERMRRAGMSRYCSIVSSRNQASISLHERLGLPVVEYRTVFER